MAMLGNSQVSAYKRTELIALRMVSNVEAPPDRWTWPYFRHAASQKKPLAHRGLIEQLAGRNGIAGLLM